MLNRVAEDDSYVAYMIATGSGIMTRCDVMYQCRIILVPHVITRSLGSGWIFRKRSALLSMINVKMPAILEKGIRSRIKWSYSPFGKGSPDQLCEDYDGQPIGINKSFSLFGIMFLGAGLSILLLM